MLRTGYIIEDLLRYQIKGLSAESLRQVALAPGYIFPGDRRFALRHAASAFDPANPSWQRKSEFLMLAHTAELAKVHTALNPDSGILKITHADNTLFVGNILNPAGKAGAESVFNALLKDPRGAIGLIDAGATWLTDVQPAYISIINLATLRDLESKTGQPVAASRFRGNIVIDGAEPWAEFGWVGKTIAMGSAQLKIVKRIGRCAATTVNPITASRDLDIPALLRQHYDHTDCGIYGEVVAGGEVRVGDCLDAS
ncbi:MAG: MOSC domain-containing protein [Rhodospirillaceae bacterium]|nr:MOSC domain-containing protein [Rhodospirillaceae bacterium]